MGFSPAQPQEATLARYRATLRLRPGSSRYRTNGKCQLSGRRSQRTPRYRSSRKGRSKRAQPEHGHALTSRSLALRAPIVDVGAGARMAPQGCHTVNSVPPAGLRGRAPDPRIVSLPARWAWRGLSLSGWGRATGRAGRRTCLATSRTFAASPINGHHLKLRVIGGWASRPARSAIRVIGIAPRTAALTTPTPSRTVVSSLHPLVPTAAWPGRASEGVAGAGSAPVGILRNHWLT